MPQPRNTTPKRLGKSAAAGVSARALTDSSQGSAMVQPAPRNNTRREKALDRRGEWSLECGMSVPLPYIGFDLFDIGGFEAGVPDFRGLRRTLVEELRAHHDGFHQGAEFVPVGLEIGGHLVHQRFIGKLQ